MNPLPISTRVMCIIQLCLAFSLLLWVLSKPFMADYFATRSELLIYQAVTGTESRFLPADKLERHAERFAQLDPASQARILETYALLERQAQKPLGTKSWESLEGLLLGLSPFTQLWLILSIAVSVMLLRRREGARLAVWLLPIIVLCYAVDNRLHAPQAALSPDSALLPTEEQLYRYFDLPVGSTLDEQRSAFILAWQRYLVDHWAHEIPSSVDETFNQQVEQGEYALTVARALARSGDDYALHTKREEQAPIALLSLYFFWNSLFAWFAGRRTVDPIARPS